MKEEWPGGPIRQLGLVVEYLDKAIDSWVNVLGVGPFYRITDQPLAKFTFRGVESAARLAIALAQNGGIQIELIQPLDDEPSAFTEFQATGGSGLQHVAYWTDDFDDTIARALDSGLRIVQSGLSGTGSGEERFAFLEFVDRNMPMIEISETRGAKARLFDAVAAGARDWDGTRPVRDMWEILK